jgi:hypothetical protein
VWQEVENNSDTGFFLYHIAMDPDIYSTGEVAWKFQFSEETTALDEIEFFDWERMYRKYE